MGKRTAVRGGAADPCTSSTPRAASMEAWRLSAGGYRSPSDSRWPTHMQQRRRVTACFFGDGAVAEGEFHESLNLAALWKLPVLFLCENNLYAMGTALGRHQSQTDIARKADAYAIPADAVNGMDVLAVESATRKAVDFVRTGNGPYLLEYRTYRFRAHSMYDAELYRTKDEVAQWKQRDPIVLFQQQLRAEGYLTDADLDNMETAIAAEIAEAVVICRNGLVGTAGGSHEGRVYASRRLSVRHARDARREGLDGKDNLP